MNKEEYQKALKSIKWITKRNIIKKRDENKCIKCGYKDKLEVHHTYYLRNKMPWEVPDECLVTLCHTCHEKEHSGRDISTFMRDTPSKHEAVEKSTIKNKKPPAKKLKLYKFIALKSRTLKKLFDKTTDLREVKKLSKSLGGVLKGFDNKDSANKWLKQKDIVKTKQKYSLSKADKELQKKYDDIKEKGKLPAPTYTPPKSQKRKKKNK